MRRNRNRIGEQSRFVAVQIFNERANAAFIIQVMFFDLRMAVVAQQDTDAGVQKCQFAIPMLKLVKIKFEHVFEGVGRRHESDARPLFGFAIGNRGIATNDQRRNRVAMFKAHPMLFAFAPDGELKIFRQCVDDGYTDAMQTARYLVCVVVRRIFKLTARVQLRHDDLSCGNALFLVHARRDAAAIIFNRDRPVGVQFDKHQIAMSGKRFVDRVVRYFEHHVVQAAAVIRIADIHSRPLANRV